MRKKIFAIVPSAGVGKRFDASIRKTFVDLNGVPLFIHTLMRLHQEDSITEIIPVIRQQDMENVAKMITHYQLPGIQRCAPGGRERQDSINNALTLLQENGRDPLKDSLVLIHDGVRPIIPEGTIQDLVRELNGLDGIAPGIPARDTLKEVGTDGIIVSTVNREKIRAIQTPQVFPFPVIKDAYDRAYKDSYYATDDAALVERMGGKVKIIAGSPLNIKVTTYEDYEMVKCALTREQKMA